MKRFFKNKYVILGSIIVILSIVYFFVNKAIDDYTSNNDIITKEQVEEISKEETNLELEQSVNNKGEQNNDENINNDEEVEESKEVNKDEDSEGSLDSNNKIYVYITGEVEVPGVVILNENSRIIDAINAAGGTTNKANVSKVNLAYVLKDGMKVNIPNDNDLKDNSNFEYITMSSGDGKKDTSSESIYSESEDKNNWSESQNSKNESNINESNSYNSHGVKVVNINTATQTELETLPGIGPSTALKIINYRKENGKFASVEDIKNVNGIGESKFETLKKYITV